ncbi:MAG: Ig-like domain-containing protein, partial [Ignavibacteriaceae bacterium]
MVKDTIKIISTTAELLLLVLISACANQLPPGGGDIDKTPPEIVDVYPANGTTNFNDDHIELEFSEYITKSSLNDVLFISPAINGKLDFNWTGKSVDINFPEPLKKNATYVVTIGTDVEDYNNKNKMKESYTFTFSTGNEIDRRTISGKVYNGKPSGVMIFAYKKGTNDINPLKDKPDYISQAGNDGAYKIAGLAEGKYRLFAIRDKYKDLLYQPSQDEYGCLSSDVTLAKSDSSLSGINFMLTERDTIPPRLLSATMTDEHHLLVGFTKGIDSTLIESGNFFLTDSTTNSNIMVGSAFKGTAKPAEIVLTIKNTISLNDDVYLIAKRLKDKYGNVFASDFVRLTISDR